MRSHKQSVVIELNRRRITGCISYKPLISDTSVLIVCNKTGGTIKGDKKNYVLLNVHLGIILVNSQLDAQSFSVYVYFDNLHVSNNHFLIIRRINCINRTSGIYHSMYVTVWYAGMHTCIPDGHLHRVIYARCIDTIDSPDAEEMVVRNM